MVIGSRIEHHEIRALLRIIFSLYVAYICISTARVTDNRIGHMEENEPCA